MMKNTANLIAAKTAAESYSRDRYTDAAWLRIVKALLEAGATAAEAEWIMNSKHTRWAADDANRAHSATSADFLAYANKRKGKEGTGLAGLIAAARKELAPTGRSGADLAGYCAGEDIADLINLAQMVANGQALTSIGANRLTARAKALIAAIEGKAK